MSTPTDDAVTTPQGSDPVANRLLRGYAPIALVALILVAVAALVPTAPEVRTDDEPAADGAAASEDGADAEVAADSDDSSLADNTPLVVGSLVLLAVVGAGLFLRTRRDTDAGTVAAGGAGGANAPPVRPEGIRGFFAVKSRLFAGYGPLAVLAALILVMAIAVPTLPVSTQGVSADGQFQGDAGESFFDETADADAADPTASTTTRPGTAPGDTGVPSTEASTPGTGGVAADGQGTGVAPVQGVVPCEGRTEQIPGDPYSPPCVGWAGGSNGGATARGVTADKIIVSYRVLGEKGFQQTLASLAGASLSDTPDSIQRTISALAEYFNQRFEFYDRSIEIAFYDGKGSNTNELLGKGRDKAVADAETVNTIGAFADLSATSEPYADALADRGIVGFGTPYLSRQWHEQRAPYAWSLATDGTRVSELAAEYSNNRLHGKPATHAEGDLKGQPRSFGIIAPDNSWYQESVENSQKITEAAGNPRAGNYQYQLNLSTMSDQANALIPKLKNDGVTTVVCGCDPIMPVFLSGAATRANYFPEFIIAGTALTDADIVGQLWKSEFSRNAFGISSLEPFVPPEQTIAYAAFKSVRPNEEPAFSVDIIYLQMYMLAIGLQGAGPNLTPQSMSDGLFNYPQRLGPFGLWKFGPGDRTAANDVREIYFDVNAVSTYNGKQGAYLSTTGERWESGQIPVGDPQVPDL